MLEMHVGNRRDVQGWRIVFLQHDESWTGPLMSELTQKKH